MDAPEQRGPVDRAVELLARVLNAVGLNGTRIQWKWNQRRRATAENTELLLRSARGRHKMCPSCRALVPRRAAACSECGTRLGTVSAPGWGRLLANVFPGVGRATSLLFLVNGLLFALMLATPSVAVPPGGLQRVMGFDIYVVLRFGGGKGAFVLVDGEWWRIVTSIFLHGGLLHVAMNSLALIRLGPLIEDLFGPEKFWSIYLWSGVAGALASQLTQPAATIIGASGAICGLVGLLLAYGVRRGGMVGRGIRNSVFEMALYILAFSLFPGVSLMSHAGGFAGGFFAGLAVPSGPATSKMATLIWQLVALAGVALVLVSFYFVAVHGQDFTKYL